MFIRSKPVVCMHRQRAVHKRTCHIGSSLQLLQKRTAYRDCALYLSSYKCMSYGVAMTNIGFVLLFLRLTLCVHACRHPPPHI